MKKIKYFFKVLWFQVLNWNMAKDFHNNYAYYFALRQMKVISLDAYIALMPDSTRILQEPLDSKIIENLKKFVLFLPGRYHW